jgi:hypothetical protein
MGRARRVLSYVATAVAWTLLSPATAGANQPPRAVANAGQNIQTGQVFNQVTVYIGPADTGILVPVTGTGSSDPDGDPLTYRWECREANNNKCVLALGAPSTQVDFRPVLPEGTWDITLTVDDNHGHTATDTVKVKVLVDSSPPVVTPPDNASVSVTVTGGARGADSDELHAFLFDSATATDNSTAIFSQLPPQVNGVDVTDDTVMPLGATSVTFRIADRFGNVGTAISEVFVVDLQPGDLFVGNGVDIGFGGIAGVIYRIRNEQTSIFCESPRNGADANYWPAPGHITVDSKGRVAAMAHLPFPNSYKFLRCNQAGQPPEKLGTFFGGFADPAWPQPFPHRNLDRIKGLHLQRRKRIVIDDNVNGGTPMLVNEERYVFAGGLEPTANESDRHSYSLATDSLTWVEDELVPVGVGVGELPEMYFHSKMESVTLPFPGGFNVTAPVASTYMVGGPTIRRVFRPLELEVSGTTPFGSFKAGIQVFGGRLDLSKEIAHDRERPQEPTGCPPVGQFRTTWTSPGRIPLDQFLNVTYQKELGLVLKSNHGGLPAWMGLVSEALLNHDTTDDQPNMYLNGFDNCNPHPIVDYNSLTPGYHVDPITGEGMDPHRTAVGVDGIYGTQPQTNRVIKLNPGVGISTVANVPFLAGAGIGAYPPQLGNVHATTVIIRIDSPVEVVVSDVHGRRLGAIAGQSINEFGQWAFDSGPESHPRFYVINHPQPGNYTVQSVGTGSGPFTVHVYSVDTLKGASQHLTSRGEASPGGIRKHDFTLSADGAVAFSNTTPIANAGADQTVEASANGRAVVTVDGSASTDPDGDPIGFTWAGPDAFARGATAQLTLSVGVHMVTLTVDDGRGGAGEDTVRITVLPGAAPTDTSPPNVTPLVTPAPNAAGWNTSSPTVTWAVEDPESAVSSSSGCAATTVTQDTAGLTLTCTATNGAGLSSSASVTVKLDTLAPTIVLVQPADGLVLSLNQAAVAHYTCADATSGIAGCAGTAASGAPFNTAAAGEHAFTVGATDAAGNTTERTHRYQVQQQQQLYVFDGFLAPLVNAPVVNRGPAGRTFPVKFRLADANGVSIANSAAIAAIMVMPGACGAAAADVPGEETNVDVGGLKYDVSTGVWHFNWKTTKSQVGCWTLEVRLADGTAHRLGFQLR